MSNTHTHTRLSILGPPPSLLLACLLFPTVSISHHRDSPQQRELIGRPLALPRPLLSSVFTSEPGLLGLVAHQRSLCYPGGAAGSRGCRALRRWISHNSVHKHTALDPADQRKEGGGSGLRPGRGRKCLSHHGGCG